MNAARTDGEMFDRRLGRCLVPDLQLVLARRNAFDVESPTCLGFGVIGRVDDKDEPKHRRVDVAEELHGAWMPERLRVCRSLLVEPRVELVRLGEREDVVEDWIVV